jgi:hypothetical protein
LLEIDFDGPEELWTFSLFRCVSADEQPDSITHNSMPLDQTVEVFLDPAQGQMAIHDELVVRHAINPRWSNPDIAEQKNKKGATFERHALQILVVPDRTVKRVIPRHALASSWVEDQSSALGCL